MIPYTYMYTHDQVVC